MLSFIKRFGLSFQKADRVLLQKMPENPGRGWYRIYTYRVGEGQLEEPVRYPGETLALVLMDIGAFRDRELDEAALSQMGQILDWFAALGFDAIVRICYDTEGKGMVREPSLFSLVKKHIVQVAKLLKSHTDNIFVYQGLLVGNWGEMHESKFLSSSCLKEMTELFRQETEGRIPLALRRPVQYRMIYPEGIAERGIGFFNDGMLGSVTHLGTFADPVAGRGPYQEMWAPEEEIAFMKPFVDEVPYGGEVVLPSEHCPKERTLEILRELRVSYLNSMHDERILANWKQEFIFEDQSLFDYVGMRLGYCLIVKDAAIKFKKQWECNVILENIGFGDLYEEAELLLWREESEKGTELVGVFPNQIKPLSGGQERLMALCFEASWENASYFVSMRRKRDKRPVFFAQAAVDGRVPIGRIQT